MRKKTALSYVPVYAEPICTLLFLLILPFPLGLNGIWLAVPLAQAATFLIALFAKLRVDPPARRRRSAPQDSDP